MSNAKITAISDSLKLGEGPHWDVEQQVLYYVDIYDDCFYKYNPENGKLNVCRMPGAPVSIVIPVHGTRDQFIVSHGRKIVRIIWDGESLKPSSIKDIAEVDKVGEGVFNRINDGKCDPFGRLFAGTMDATHDLTQLKMNSGSFYRFDAHGIAPKLVADQISISNGIAWNVEKKIMYYIDSLTHQVDQFDYDPTTGEVANRRLAFDFKKHQIPGFPDGMTIDTEGKLWVACYSSGRIVRIDPESDRLLETIPLPAKRITSIAFGGPNLDVLYVTSARDDTPCPNGDDGKVFKITGLHIKGYPGSRMKL